MGFGCFKLQCPCAPINIEGELRHILCPRKNEAILRTTMENLTAKKEDLQDEEKERYLVKFKQEVSQWIEAVEALEGDTKVLLNRSRTSNSWSLKKLSCCLCSNYELGDGILKAQERANMLKQQYKDGQFDDKNKLWNEVPISLAPPPPTVGIEGMLSDILNRLENNRRIGIYGMGGVGKTTLLKHVSNSIYHLSAHDDGKFSPMIDVVVSKDFNIVDVQKKIYSDLRLTFIDDETTENRANKIYTALVGKKFLLMLDDVWEPLDLQKLGIFTENSIHGSKVIFTTRRKDVCHHMNAYAFEVKTLDEKFAWELFHRSLGNEEPLKNREISEVARSIVKKCGGLPITLTTVARAVATFGNNIPSWRCTERELDDFPHEIKDMEQKVLKLLKFSFDKLENDATRSALLYCCLYPEDRNIPIEELIDYWIGEGLLGDDRNKSINHLRGKGSTIIKSLQAACLLEQGSFESVVKMHDTVRDMTLWLGQGGDGYQHKFFSIEGRQIVQIDHKWAEFERVSIMNDKIEGWHVDENSPQCKKLLSFIFNVEAFGKKIPPTSLFSSMPSIRVLDLSWMLREHLLQGLCELRELRYLNLGGTDVEHLPEDLGKLTKLRLLDLSYTPKLRSIPREAISSLTDLQSLKLRKSSCKIGDGLDGQLSFADLDGMDKLEELELPNMTSNALEKHITI